MSHIVTATIIPKSSLRVEKSSPPRKIVIGSGFTGKDGRRFFFTEDGRDEIDLEISDQKQFDLDKPYEKHNWLSLQAFCLINKNWGRDIQLIDERAENDKAIKFADQVFEVEQFLRSKRTDHVLMSKLYRRLIGLAAGLPETAVFRGLLELAKEKPEKFIRGGKIVADHEEFEMLALVDISVERGFLLKDLDGTIKKHDGVIYAQNIQKAAYQLTMDDQFRTYLQRAVEGKIEVKEERYNFDIEDDSEYTFLADQVGLSSEGLLQIKEGQVKSDQKDSEDEIDINIGLFVKAGFIERSGTGNTTRYRMPDVSNDFFTKKQLIAHFVLNYSHYDNIKESASAK